MLFLKEPLCKPNQVSCVQGLKPDLSICEPNCKGILVTSYSKKKNFNIQNFLSKLANDYEKYKGLIVVPPEIKGILFLL